MSEEQAKTIYVVTDGEYSDYGIMGIFDDPTLAEQFRRQFGYDQVEEYDLNPCMPQLRAGMQAFCVEMARDGTVQRAKRSDRPPYDDAVHFFVWRNSLMETEMWAKDEQHAIKIANERRIRALANDEWPKRKETA